MPHAQLKGANLFYEESGKGRAVIMVPGLVADHRYWNNLAQFLSSSFRVIAVDNRGCGQTEYGGAFTIDDMADDIIGLMDHLGIEKANLIGWSMGSHICLDAAARYPERTESLCLLSSYCYRPARSAYVLSNLGRQYAEGRTDAATVAQVFNQFMKPESWFLKMQEAGREVHSAQLPEPQMVIDQLTAVDGYDPSVHAGMVSCPTLSIHGLQDIMTEPRQGDALAQMIKGCSTLRIPDEGHNISPQKYGMGYAVFLNSVRDGLPRPSRLWSPLWHGCRATYRPCSR